MWLRDRLPREMPNVRSIIYGYDTALIGSESVKGVDDIAIALISKMKSIGRSSPSAKPLLMLAHSLGGIVLKQAMVTMARTGDSSNVMVDLIRSVVFFGVPNQGMKVSYLLPMVEDQPNAHIVHLLSTDSDYLQSLDRQFSGIVTHRGVRIMSVYETKRSATTQVCNFPLLILMSFMPDKTRHRNLLQASGGEMAPWTSSSTSRQPYNRVPANTCLLTRITPT